MQRIIFSKWHRHFYSYSYLQPVGKSHGSACMYMPLSIYESRRAQRRHRIAVKVQDKVPLADGNCILVGRAPLKCK